MKAISEGTGEEFILTCCHWTSKPGALNNVGGSDFLKYEKIALKQQN